MYLWAENTCQNTHHVEPPLGENQHTVVVPLEGTFRFSSSGKCIVEDFSSLTYGH